MVKKKAFLKEMLGPRRNQVLATLAGTPHCAPNYPLRTTSIPSLMISSATTAWHLQINRNLTFLLCHQIRTKAMDLKRKWEAMRLPIPRPSGPLRQHRTSNLESFRSTRSSYHSIRTATRTLQIREHLIITAATPQQLNTVQAARRAFF